VLKQEVARKSDLMLRKYLIKLCKKHNVKEAKKIRTMKCFKSKLQNETVTTALEALNKTKAFSKFYSSDGNEEFVIDNFSMEEIEHILIGIFKNPIDSENEQSEEPISEDFNENETIIEKKEEQKINKVAQFEEKIQKEKQIKTNSPQKHKQANFEEKIKIRNDQENKSYNSLLEYYNKPNQTAQMENCNQKNSANDYLFNMIRTNEFISNYLLNQNNICGFNKNTENSPKLKQMQILSDIWKLLNHQEIKEDTSKCAQKTDLSSFCSPQQVTTNNISINNIYNNPQMSNKSPLYMNGNNYAQNVSNNDNNTLQYNINVLSELQKNQFFNPYSYEVVPQFNQAKNNFNLPNLNNFMNGK